LQITLNVTKYLRGKVGKEVGMSTVVAKIKLGENPTHDSHFFVDYPCAGMDTKQSKQLHIAGTIHSNKLNYSSPKTKQKIYCNDVKEFSGTRKATYAGSCT